MEWWDWIGVGGFAIGVVAFLMAVQPFVQYCFGQPKLKVLFNVMENEDGRILHCELFNPQVSRVLRKMGIRRDPIQGLSVSASIVDLRTHKTMVREDFATLLDPEAEKRSVMDITAPEAVVLIWVAMVRKSDEKALTALRMDEGQIELPPSEYLCHLIIKSASVDEELCRKFMVGTQPHELYWERTSS